MKNYWSLKLSNTLLFLCICASIAVAQLSPDKTMPIKKNIPSEPYLFPINPEKENGLTGTLGELRTTHLHSGIDIRTENRIGVPVQATQRGYISRIIIGAYSYGQALWIKHPDGNESVYAHLDHFKKDVAAFVLKKQYEKKSFDLDIELTPDQFAVKQGDTIAFSGNTGASSGPHLHFEIRDNNNNALNPLEFKFNEINDVLAPIAQRIVLRTMNENARIGKQFGRKEYSLIRNGNNYFVNQPIRATGKIGIELLAYDRVDYSRFQCGINEIEIRVDNQQTYIQKIDKVNFFEYRQMASLIDFEILKSRGLQFYKLYRDEENRMPYYKQSKTDGFISVSDKNLKIEILLRDIYGNTSSIHFNIEPLPKEPNTVVSVTESALTNFSINENILQFSAPCNQESITVFKKGIPSIVKPSYTTSVGQATYLINLQRLIPDSAKTCSGIMRFTIKDAIPSGIDYTYYSDWAVVRFSPQSLYDTLFLEQSKKNNGREVYTLGSVFTPLKNEIDITLQPTEKQTSTTSVYRMSGNYFQFIASRWDNGKINFKTKELGDFVLLDDSSAPAIYRIQCDAKSARFRISDNLSGIDSFQASINGEWLLMKYDYKTAILQSEKLDATKSLQGDFELKVKDRAGNEKVYKQKIF